MNAPPVRPIENVLTMIGAVLVAGAVFPWRFRLACAVAAIGVVLLLAALRFRAHAVRVQKRRTFDTYGTVQRIRADRKARFESGRPRRR